MTDGVCRKCRREGTKLFLKGERCMSPKCAFARRSYVPGMYFDRSQRLSEYGIHLRAKQKVKRIYGMREREFRRFFDEAKKEKNTGLVLLQKLECRLDNVVCKVGWAVSIASARQLVSHGHITVNGKTVDVPSYVVRIGDTVELKKRLWDIPGKQVPWIDITKDSCTIKSYPTREMIDPGIEENLIIEFYSR